MKGISNLGSLRRLENINARSGSSQPYTQPPKKCDGGKEKKKVVWQLALARLLRFVCVSRCSSERSVAPRVNVFTSGSLGNVIFFPAPAVGSETVYGSLEDDQDENSPASEMSSVCLPPESPADIM